MSMLQHSSVDVTKQHCPDKPAAATAFTKITIPARVRPQPNAHGHGRAKAGKPNITGADCVTG